MSASNPWHPTILWYARAVGALEARNRPNFDDPGSWRHLAETHGSQIRQREWPAGARWNTCEHESWHFLPWHRVYLHHFERIVRDQIIKLGGPQDWALPFWNYSDPSRAAVRTLPPAFISRRMPDGRQNPLFVGQRSNDSNAGRAMASAVVDALDGLAAAGARIKWPNDVLVDGRKVAGLRTATAAVGSGAAALSLGDEGQSRWNRIASILPLIALVGGLILIHAAQNEHRAHEVAEVDAALLTDDLPPAAYADPGFIQFLKTSGN